MQIEIIVINKEEAILAEKCGATRVELIHAFELGGLSPKLKITKEVCDTVTIPVNIMLRPHDNSNGNGNNFVYNTEQINTILAELKYIRDNTNANGIVFGALDENHNLDVRLLECIIQNKGHLQLTFHRAIDVSCDIITTYQQLLTYPEVDLVLTSGGRKTALEGIHTIKRMVQIHYKNRHNNAQIMAGSGINLYNIQQVMQQTNVNHVHLGTGVRTTPDNALSEQKLQQLFQRNY